MLVERGGCGGEETFYFAAGERLDTLDWLRVARAERRCGRLFSVCSGFEPQAGARAIFQREPYSAPPFLGSRGGWPHPARLCLGGENDLETRHKNFGGNGARPEMPGLF